MKIEKKVALVLAVSCLALALAVYGIRVRQYPMITPTTLASNVKVYADPLLAEEIEEGIEYDFGVPVAEGDNITIFVSNRGNLKASSVSLNVISSDCAVFLNQTLAFSLDIDETKPVKMTFTNIVANPIHWTLQSEFD